MLRVWECSWRHLVGGLMVAIVSAMGTPAWSQTGQISGEVADEQSKPIVNAAVSLIDQAQGVEREVRTNGQGIYSFPSLRPGTYEIRATAERFSPDRRIVIVQVDSAATVDFMLHVAGVVEEVSVDVPVILRSRDGSVGTVITRQIINNIPLNGRSFQTLLELTPGVTLTSTGQTAAGGRGGQYSINGQRTDGNNFLVDGVSANLGIGGDMSPGGTAAGAAPATTVLGGFQGLASVDAVEEFRVQTSSFAPEFGRASGGHISIVTRSGTNRYSGSLFEYFRDERMDANDWFNNSRGVRKPNLTQHNFGGVLGGPIIQDRWFFFGSYEGLRLTQPAARVDYVPSVALRERAHPTYRAIVNAFPLPTTDTPGVAGMAEYIAPVSNPSSFDAISGKIDVRSGNTSLFGRFSYTPSWQELSLTTNELRSETRLWATTLGATHVLSSRSLIETRINFSSSEGNASSQPTTRNGAIPLGSFDSFAPFVPNENTLFSATILTGGTGLIVGPRADNWQHQVNIVTSASTLFGRHNLKAGFDLRWMEARSRPQGVSLSLSQPFVDGIVNGMAASQSLGGAETSGGNFMNVALFAQDTWRTTKRLTLTYGLRWEVNPAPSNDRRTPHLRPVNFHDTANLDLVEGESTLWQTNYAAVAPRLGFAYDLWQNKLGLTGGVGLFYDIGTQAARPQFFEVYPYNRSAFGENVRLPLDLVQSQVPPITAQPPYTGSILLVDPDLATPYTTSWNAALDYQLTGRDSITVTYAGARGRNLFRNISRRAVNARFPGVVQFTSNDAESSYKGLYLQYTHRNPQAFQVLASYQLASSQDDISDSITLTLDPKQVVSDDWGPSSFDIRHQFSMAATFELGGIGGRLLKRVLAGTAIDVLTRARSGTPFTVTATNNLSSNGVVARADLVPGVPVWIDDAASPGGRRLNQEAFKAASPGRQGTSGRNAWRGFPAAQVDLALRRELRLGPTRVQLRCEAFNVLNTPMFANPAASVGVANFGRPRSSLSDSLAGGLSGLYQFGRSRSIQMGVKILY